MVYIPPKIPWILRKLFPSYLWRFRTKEKVLYLTFDDGPIPDVTENVLAVLKDFDAKATFFCIGDNVKKHPEIFKKILADGHTIGNHTYHHIRGWKTSKEKYIENILMTESVLDETLNNTPLNPSFDREGLSSKGDVVKLFRPPYGEIKPSQGRTLQKLGYKIVMWDIVAIDWKAEILEETVLKNVIDNATEGSVVVFHDSIKASKNMSYALPRTLAYFKDRGYKFRAINPHTLA